MLLAALACADLLTGLGPRDGRRGADLDAGPDGRPDLGGFWVMAHL
ncbi:MAG: hypothetical protein ACU0A6_10015 [Shimia sp.]|jgi:hypothetical protein